MSGKQEVTEVETFYKNSLLAGIKKIVELFVAQQIEAPMLLKMIGIETQRFCLMTNRPFAIQEDSDEDTDFISGSEEGSDTDDYAEDMDQIY